MIEDLGIVNDKCEEFNFDFMKIVLYSAVILWNNVLVKRDLMSSFTTSFDGMYSINRVTNNS